MTAKTIIELLVILAWRRRYRQRHHPDWRNRKREDRAVEAKVGLDDATKAKIVQDAAHSIEQDYLNRLADFRKEIERLNGELNNERERASEWATA